jgi:hypothetical protein
VLQHESRHGARHPTPLSRLRQRIEESLSPLGRGQGEGRFSAEYLIVQA